MYLVDTSSISPTPHVPLVVVSICMVLASGSVPILPYCFTVRSYRDCSLTVRRSLASGSHDDVNRHIADVSVPPVRLMASALRFIEAVCEPTLAVSVPVISPGLLRLVFT